MRKHYDFSKGRRNPYAKLLKQQITIRLDKPTIEYFKELAVNMVGGNGYSIDSSFWPGEPSMRRMPGWPFLIAVSMKLLPVVQVDVLMRLLACLLHALSAVLVYRLALRVAQGEGTMDHALAKPKAWFRLASDGLLTMDGERLSGRGLTMKGMKKMKGGGGLWTMDY